MKKKTQRKLARETEKELEKTQRELKKAIASGYIFLLGIFFGVLGNMIAEILFIEIIPRVSNTLRYTIEGLILLSFILLLIVFLKKFKETRKLSIKINRLIALKEKRKKLNK